MQDIIYTLDMVFSLDPKQKLIRESNCPFSGWPQVSFVR